MLAPYDQNVKKSPVNLNINGDLLNKAKDMGINLSVALEQALTHQLKAIQAQQWLDQKKAPLQPTTSQLLNMVCLVMAFGVSRLRSLQCTKIKNY